MSRKQYSLSHSLVVATALALGASGVATADDSSMRRFGGDSYAYFANQPLINAPSAWRQTHPKGLTERELQALSSSDLSVFVSLLNPPVFATAPVDTAWRQSHPNGLTEPELLALSASSVSRWQGDAKMATPAPGVARIAEGQTFAARLSNFFHPRRDSKAGADQ